MAEAYKRSTRGTRHPTFKMPRPAPKRLSLFRDQIENRRFGDWTLRILESVLSAKDVESLVDTRSSLRELLRSEAVYVLREVSRNSADEKLSVAEFFVQAFALVGDVESCLALRYEAMILRELKYMTQDTLRVCYEEWLRFAEDSLHNGYYSIAVKGCDHALFSIQSKEIADIQPYDFCMESQMVRKIKKLRNRALELDAPRSVQTRTADYLKEKAIQFQKNQESHPTGARCPASLLFRNAIKARNMKKLRKSQELMDNED
ncbi:hypothetical protein Taro_034601 [Colocasia esculenta]|uniref:Uncharacterized protein n=1 Tax=Colocasia esculenta TaxID=4460 RepID=A0A843W831_COLES|nr:hypothetical protein [Colocasia esculenta]